MYIIITNYSYRAFSEKEKNIFTTWGIDSRFSDRKNFKIYSLPHGQCATNPCNFFFNYLATYMSILEKSLNMIYSLDFLYEDKLKLK